MSRKTGEARREPSALEEVMREVREARTLVPRTALEALRDKRRPLLGTGCEVLDEFLGGGLREGVTELAGDSAAGKTQIALQLLLQAQLPPGLGGLDAGSFYLCTEDFPMKRLRQLAEAFKRKHPWTSEFDYCENVYVEVARSVHDMCVMLDRLPRLLESEKNPVRLVVVDSIAAIFRSEFDGGELRERLGVLMAVAARLKKLSDEHGCVVVVVNQVTDLFEGAPEYARHHAFRSANRWVVPAMGVGWASCVNARICLGRGRQFAAGDCGGDGDGLPRPAKAARTGGGADGGAPSADPVQRHMLVSFSPWQASAEAHDRVGPLVCGYTVDADGVHGTGPYEPANI